ncbi:MAG: MoaD/ThiS family protein [Alicyclobacillus sp.]|nr:MoaD/ThiS family protein [Alicyclobacillus sp.]
MITVHLPVTLADAFGAEPLVTLPGQTLADVLRSLDARYPGMAAWLVEPDGRLRPHLSVFISGHRLPPQSHISVRLQEDSDVWVLQAISGG